MWLVLWRWGNSQFDFNTYGFHTILGRTIYMELWLLHILIAFVKGHKTLWIQTRLKYHDFNITTSMPEGITKIYDEYEYTFMNINEIKNMYI